MTAAATPFILPPLTQEERQLAVRYAFQREGMLTPEQLNNHADRCVKLLHHMRDSTDPNVRRAFATTIHTIRAVRSVARQLETENR